MRTYLGPRSSAVGILCDLLLNGTGGVSSLIDPLTPHRAGGSDMTAHRRRTEAPESTTPLVPEQQRLVNELKDRFQKLFLSTKEATFIIDSAATQVLDVNLQASTLVGYSRWELLSLPATRILARKEDISASRNLNRKVRYTTEFRHKSGTSIPCEVSTRPVQFDQKPCFLVIAHRASQSQMAKR
jgi:PAS domain S-box-containing protein